MKRSLSFCLMDLGVAVTELWDASFQKWEEESQSLWQLEMSIPPMSLSLTLLFESEQWGWSFRSPSPSLERLLSVLMKILGAQGIQNLSATAAEHHPRKSVHLLGTNVISFHDHAQVDTAGKPIKWMSLRWKGDVMKDKCLSGWQMLIVFLISP